MEPASAVTDEQLTSVAVLAIVAKAVALSRDTTEQERLALYGQAKAAIERFNPTAEEYEKAVRLLAEGLNI